jgi:hypothetical protein
MSWAQASKTPTSWGAWSWEDRTGSEALKARSMENNELYPKKNATRAVSSVIDRSAGSKPRRPAAGGFGDDHAARNGASRISAMPVNSSRWVGLSSAAMPVSIPKT